MDRLEQHRVEELEVPCDADSGGDATCTREILSGKLPEPESQPLEARRRLPEGAERPVPDDPIARTHCVKLTVDAHQLDECPPTEGLVELADRGPASNGAGGAREMTCPTTDLLLERRSAPAPTTGGGRQLRVVELTFDPAELGLGRDDHRVVVALRAGEQSVRPELLDPREQASCIPAFDSESKPERRQLLSQRRGSRPQLDAAEREPVAVEAIEPPRRRSRGGRGCAFEELELRGDTCGEQAIREHCAPTLRPRSPEVRPRPSAVPVDEVGGRDDEVCPVRLGLPACGRE